MEQQQTGEYVMIPLGNTPQQYLSTKTEDENTKLCNKMLALQARIAINISYKWIAKKADINKNVSCNFSPCIYYNHSSSLQRYQNGNSIT